MSLSSLLMHGVLCDTLMVTIIAPIIKNKSGDLSDNNNHRPSNLVESLILQRNQYYHIPSYMCQHYI